jgi:cytoskeletal protein RodZ
MSFSSHPIQSETLGNFLKKIRQSSGWQLKDISQRIKIKEEYLQALEEDNYHQLPSPTYARGFLEHYAEFLNLDPKQIIERYRRESQFFEVREKILKKQGLTQSTLPGFLKKKKISTLNLQKIGTIVVVIVFLFYFIWLVGQALLPPKIIIFFPNDNFETNEKIIQIKGRTNSNAIVKINDQPVSKFENGFFEENLNLLPGINEIKISARKKNSSETVIWRKIIVRE